MNLLGELKYVQSKRMMYYKYLLYPISLNGDVHIFISE